MKCNYWWVWPHHLFTFFKLHSTLGIKFSKTGFLQLVDSGSQPLICKVWRPGTLTLSPGRQSARMSKITNDRLNPVWHSLLYSCTHMSTVGVKGSKIVYLCQALFGCSHATKPACLQQTTQVRSQLRIELKEVVNHSPSFCPVHIVIVSK